MPMVQQDLAPEIAAASAIVIDFETGDVLYEKDADTMRVPASMTKVMTAYIIFEELEAGNLALDTEITITRSQSQLSNNKNYPAMVYLPVGMKVDVDTLLKLILLPSASASCVVMAEKISGTEAAFVQRMNETAKRLDLDAEYFNAHGVQSNQITARAQALLVQDFIRRFPTVLEYTSMHSVKFNGKIYHNTNPLAVNGDYEGADGFKTGTMPAAGFCLAATAERDGQRLVSVVMKSTDNKHRNSDSVAILDYAFAQLAQKAIPASTPPLSPSPGKG